MDIIDQSIVGINGWVSRFTFDNPIHFDSSPTSDVNSRWASYWGLTLDYGTAIRPSASKDIAWGSNGTMGQESRSKRARSTITYKSSTKIREGRLGIYRLFSLTLLLLSHLFSPLYLFCPLFASLSQKHPVPLAPEMPETTALTAAASASAQSLNRYVPPIRPTTGTLRVGPLTFEAVGPSKLTTSPNNETIHASPRLATDKLSGLRRPTSAYPIVQSDNSYSMMPHHMSPRPTTASTNPTPTSTANPLVESSNALASIARPGTIGDAVSSAALSVYTLPRRQLDAIASTVEHLGKENASLHFELDVLRRRARRLSVAEDDEVSAALADMSMTQLSTAKGELTKLVERLLAIAQEREALLEGQAGMVTRTREALEEKEKEIVEWKERLLVSTEQRHKAEDEAEKAKASADKLKEQVQFVLCKCILFDFVYFVIFPISNLLITALALTYVHLLASLNTLSYIIFFFALCITIDWSIKTSNSNFK